MKIIFTLLVIISCQFFMYSHPGRTDSNGGHTNRKTGDYHYHNSGSKHDTNNPYQNHDNCGLCNEITNAESIKKAQIALRDIHLYSGEITGTHDSITIEAIKKAQAKYGINQTGRLTKALMRKLIK